MSSIPRDERERRRRIRESVRNFYEVENTTATSTSSASASASASMSPSPLHSSLNRGTVSETGSSVAAAPFSSTTNVGAGGERNTTTNNLSATEMDIDSVSFNPTSYTTALLKTSTLPKLLDSDTALRHSVKSLDKELQDLVYSNYAKFIAAAETIKEVRSSVNDMESKLQDLDKNVEKMENVSNRVTRELEKHRHLVDQEVATNSMLRKVQFLVMLPQIMTSAAQAEKWLDAANYWAAGDVIFTKYAEFPSFVRTQNECRLQAEKLYATISSKICDSPIEADEIGNLQQKLSALKLLTSTSLDFERLGQQLGVLLLPSSSSSSSSLKNTVSATSSTENNSKIIDNTEITEQAREYFKKRLVSNFKEQVEDTVAHIKLDFLHRQEDLERHTKREEWNKKEEKEGENNNNESTTTSLHHIKNKKGAAEQIKSSLVDLSLALRKRYISKLETVITTSFRSFTQRMKVINAVCGDERIIVGGNNNENENENNNNNNQEITTTTDDSSPIDRAIQLQRATVAVLEPALSKLLSEVCTCTISWIKNCLKTFSSVITHAVMLFEELSSSSFASSFSSSNKNSERKQHQKQLHSLVEDVEMTITTMCETFFGAILDTEKTFSAISDNFLSVSAVAPVISSSPATAAETNTSNVTVTTTGESQQPQSPSRKFNDRVSTQTEQLLIDLELLFEEHAKPCSLLQLVADDDENDEDEDEKSNNGAEKEQQQQQEQQEEESIIQKERENKEKKRIQKIQKSSQKLVPLLCFAAVAKTCANKIIKSDLASYASYLRHDFDVVESHRDTFIAAATSLSNMFVRAAGLKCVNEMKKQLFFADITTSFPNCESNDNTNTNTVTTPSITSSILNTGNDKKTPKFLYGSEICTTEPVDASNLFIELVSSIRRHFYVIYLLLSGGGANSNSSNANENVSESSSTQQQQSSSSVQKKGPFVAQFMRRDAVVGLKADMDRMFAAKSTSNASASAIATSSSKQMYHQQQPAHSSSSPSSWYAVPPRALDNITVAESVLMHIMTSLVEVAREEHSSSSSSSCSSSFSKYGFQQAQVDSSLLLHCLSDLRESCSSMMMVKGAGGGSSGLVIMHEEVSTSMVNEFACCVFDRTKDRAPLSNAVVEQLAMVRWRQIS